VLKYHDILFYRQDLPEKKHFEKKTSDRHNDRITDTSTGNKVAREPTKRTVVQLPLMR